MNTIQLNEPIPIETPLGRGSRETSDIECGGVFVNETNKMEVTE